MNNKLLEDAREAGFCVSDEGRIHYYYGFNINSQLARFAELQQPQALLSQGEPVGKVTSKLGDICAFKSSQVNKGDLLYTAPPSTESLQYEVSAKIGKLQKDKAELIEYASKLHENIAGIAFLLETDNLMAELCKDALDILQPKCMQGK